jgi:hypothetical protein
MSAANRQNSTAERAYQRAMRRALERKPFLRSKGRYLTREEAHQRVKVDEKS